MRRSLSKRWAAPLWLFGALIFGPPGYTLPARTQTPMGPPISLSDFEVCLPSYPAVAPHPDGGFVVVWLRPDALAVARFDLEGRATGPVLGARPEPPGILGGLQTLGAHSSGDLWLLSPVGPAACDIPCGSLTLLRLAAGGTELQTVIQGAVSFVRSADLAVLTDGEVALALGSYGDVKVLRFDAAGRVSGPNVGELEPVAVAEDPLGSLRVLDLSSDAAGNLLLVWAASGMAGARLRARSLTPEALPAGPELSLTERSILSDFSARAAPLETGEAVVVWSDVLQAPIDPLPCATSPGPFARRLSLGGPQALVLGDGRFRVEVEWLVPLHGTEGRGRARPDSDDTGSFWFFDPDNLELTVKVLDGRPVNGHFWFFYGALSNVGYRISVTDQHTGRVRTYDNPPGRFGSFADTNAFSGAVP